MPEKIKFLENKCEEYFQSGGEALRTKCRTEISAVLGSQQYKDKYNSLRDFEVVCLALAICKRYQELWCVVAKNDTRWVSERLALRVASLCYKRDLKLAETFLECVPTESKAKARVLGKINEQMAFSSRFSVDELCALRESDRSLQDKVCLIFDSFSFSGEVGYDNEAFSEDKGEVTFVFVNGLGWSGSGAVYDALYDDSRSAPFYMGELVWMTSELGKLRRDWTFEAFEDFVLTMLLGKKFRKNAQESGGRSFLPPTSLLKCYVQNYPGWIGALRKEVCSLIEDFECGCSNAARIRKFFSRVLSVGSQHQFVLVNNSIKCQQIVNEDCFPENCRFICVYRDYRDQFSELYYDGMLTSVGEFEIRAKQFDRFALAYEVCDKSRVKAVCFDDFVYSEEYRKDLFDWLGLEGVVASDNSKPRFRPEESQRNVGKYKNFHDPLMIQELEKAYGSYFSKLD